MSLIDARRPISEATTLQPPPETQPEPPKLEENPFETGFEEFVPSVAEG